MTVIAVLDWMTPVINVPASTPLIGVPAILASSARILLTARSWMPLDMNSRPSMKMPSPPMTGTRMSLKIVDLHAPPLRGSVRMATRSGYAKVGRRQASVRIALERLCTIPDPRRSGMGRERANQPHNDRRLENHIYRWGCKRTHMTV